MVAVAIPEFDVESAFDGTLADRWERELRGREDSAGMLCLLLCQLYWGFLHKSKSKIPPPKKSERLNQNATKRFFFGGGGFFLSKNQKTHCLSMWRANKSERWKGFRQSSTQHWKRGSVL